MHALQSNLHLMLYNGTKLVSTLIQLASFSSFSLSSRWIPFYSISHPCVVDYFALKLPLIIVQHLRLGKQFRLDWLSKESEWKEKKKLRKMSFDHYLYNTVECWKVTCITYNILTSWQYGQSLSFSPQVKLVQQAGCLILITINGSTQG